MTWALPFSFSLLIRKKLGNLWGVVSCSAFFLVVEWIWSHGPIAMPGTLLGHAMAGQHYVNQIVDITGVAGLTLWILCINWIGLFIWKKKAITERMTLITVMVILIATPVAYSAFRLNQASLSHNHTKIAVVQPAVESTAWSNEKNRDKVKKLIAQTDSLLSQSSVIPDMVVWPETALPALSLDRDTLVTTLQQWSKARGVPLLAGAILAFDNPEKHFTNSALLFVDTLTVQRYDKNWLVPFAEHVPFEESINALTHFRVDAGGVYGYKPGNNQPLLKLGSASFGTLICFESLFGDYSRKYVSAGADFLLAISNVGWWGPQPAPEQYLAFSSLRAIETRRNLVVNTVTGPSVHIDQYGKRENTLDWMQPGLMMVNVPHGIKTTFYVNNGDWLSFLSIMISLVVVILYLRAKYKHAF